MKIKPILFLIIALILSIQSDVYAQLSKRAQKKMIKKFQSFLDKDADLIFINNYQSFEKIEGEYVLKTYNPDKRILTTYTTFADITMRKKQGITKEWFDNGQLWKVGEFNKNEEHGDWKIYKFPNGQLDSYGAYKNGEKDSIWIELDSKERINKRIQYILGDLHGDYICYDTLGLVVNKKKYSFNEEINDEMIDSLYYIKKFNKNIKKAVAKKCTELSGEEREECSNNEYLKFVYSHIRYPEKARVKNIEGESLIQFVINKEGKISDIQTLRGVSKEIEKECIRVIRTSPDWSPATNNGKVIRMQYRMPVKFKLQ